MRNDSTELIAKDGGFGYNKIMEKKEIDNISEFFSRESGPSVTTPDKKWEEIFSGWIDKIDQEKMILNLFELKLWFEGLEEFNSSSYLEGLVFKNQAAGEKNYEFYVQVFFLVATRITALLKELDFKKDKYFLNFEEFIVEKILEDNMGRSFPYLKELHSPESWFYSFRIFLQNYRCLVGEILRNESVSQKVYASIKKLYHRELIGNTMLISLLKRRFIPKMDRIFQPDILKIISSTRDKSLKKILGIFFVLSFRILKIDNFIEIHLNRSKYLDLTIPLILMMVRNLDSLIGFNDTMLLKCLDESGFDRKELGEIREIVKNMKMEFRKIGEGELPLYFDSEADKGKKRKMIKNIILISEVAIQELVESVVRLFMPEISGTSIFENYISRKQKSIEVKKKLIKLHSKINDFFIRRGSVSPSEIFFDINLFMETDLNYLLYKDWNEFLSYYNNLNRTNFSVEFEPTLRAFHSFLTRILKEIVNERKSAS